MCDPPDGNVLSDELAVADPEAEVIAGGLRTALAVGLVVIVIDHVTKWWAVDRLVEGPCTPETCIDVIGSLRFHLYYNTGASFGTGEGFGVIIGLIASAMAVYLLLLARKATDRQSVILFGVIAGGAVGNILDRLFRADDGFMSGGVVDFIDFQFWPIFNIADMAVVGGVLLLLARSLFSDDTPIASSPT